MNTASIDRFGIPGRIVPGGPKELTNFPMTSYNHLRTIVGTRPDVIQGMFKHFAEETGMISELMQYAGGSYDKTVSGFLNKKKMDNPMKELDKKFKIMNNLEYAWMSPAPQGFVYRVEVAPVPDGDGTVGRNHAEFSFVVNKQLGDKDDVWMLNDHTSQIILTRQPEMTADGRLRVWARLLTLEGDHGRALPVDEYLFRGAELEPLYNLKPEASEHGSKTRVAFGEWHRGWMSTLRWEWNITGHAAHVKNSKERMALIYTAPNGDIEPYWVETWRYNLMKKKYREMDNHLFWGMPYLDREGRFAKDKRGYKYYSGTGLYFQANRRLKREYTRLNDFTIIDDLMQGMYYDAIENKQDNCILAIGGLSFRKDFGKLMRNEFRASPEVLYFDGFGNYHTASQMKDKGIMGIRSNFTYYETEVGKFIVSNCNYFDHKSRSTRLTSEGTRELSHRALLINVGDLIGGNKAFTMVTLNGRQNVLGRVAGMSNPGPGNVLTTTADVEGEHMLTMQGIALHNPNCLAELKLARGRR